MRDEMLNCEACIFIQYSICVPDLIIRGVCTGVLIVKSCSLHVNVHVPIILL